MAKYDDYGHGDADGNYNDKQGRDRNDGGESTQTQAQSMAGKQAAVRQMDQEYLDSQAGAKSFYDAMNSAWHGNISDVDLSQYMDSVGTGYEQRSPLLGSFDALATGRGGFGDYLSRGFDSIVGNIPGLGLLSGGIDIAQRLMNGGVVGGDMFGKFVGGLTGNPLLGMGARVGMNAYNGIPLERQLLSELTNNAPMLAGMMGFNPMFGAAAGQVGRAMQDGELSFGGLTKGLF